MKKVLFLLNMGGPSNLDEVCVFLKNMFNDKYIISVKSNLLRKFIAYMIVSFRKKEAKKNYEMIGGKSPICDITSSLVKKLKNSDYEVDFIMNYTPPFAKDVLKKYKDADEFILLPLYPHHSSTTILSSIDDVQFAMRELGLNQKITQIPYFYENNLYNDVILNLIIEKIKSKNLNPQDIVLIFSAHSLPIKIIQNGDLYEKHIQDHVFILSKKLQENGVIFKDIKLAYQSKLGPVEWLGPNIVDVMKEITHKKVIVFPIAFCIDNSETIFEIDIEYKKLSKELNYEFFDVIECPNDRDDFAKFIDTTTRNTFCL